MAYEEISIEESCLHCRHLSQVQPMGATPTGSGAKAAEAGADFAADFLHRHYGSPSSKGIVNVVTCAAQLGTGDPMRDRSKKRN